MKREIAILKDRNLMLAERKRKLKSIQEERSFYHCEEYKIQCEFLKNEILVLNQITKLENQIGEIKKVLKI